MKLTGNPSDLAEYHTREENYYFSQGGDGSPIPFDESKPVQHVSIYGKMCSEVGLQDGQLLSEIQFTRLLSGQNAAGDKISKTHKVHGIDITFSAPKTVSVAGLVTDRDPRITAAHDKAVLDTMREIEEFSAGTQPKAGQHVKTGNMLWASVRDGFSREHDPHIHTHVVIMNMTNHGNKIMALDGRAIMARDFNKMWGAVYRGRLAENLKESGYGITYTKKGEWRLDSVSRELEVAFSQRRRQIVAQKEIGRSDLEAWNETRKGKNPDISKADILKTWQETVGQFKGKVAGANRREAIEARMTWFQEAKWAVEAKQELAGERVTTEPGMWQLAARRATERTSCPSKHGLIIEYLTEVARGETWGAVSYAEAERRLKTQVQEGRIIEVEPERFTTWEMMRVEREYMRPGAQSVSLAMAEPRLSAMMALYEADQQAAGKRNLSSVQRVAATGILSSKETVVVLQGDAGSGKTTLLRTVNDLAVKEGWDVRGVSVQGVAARKLEEESGIKSTTLSSYLSQKRGEGGTPRLVVVDEASMLDSRSMTLLIQEAEKHQDKILLVGDKNQLESVGAGRPFDRLVEDAQRRGALLSLSENFRQRDETLRQAVDLAKEGDMRGSLDLLDGQARVCELSKTEDRRQTVAELYNEDTLIITGTTGARDQLNELIRHRLLKEGVLKEKEGIDFELAKADEDGVWRKTFRTFAPGEKITFLQNEYKELDVRNGERGTVLGVENNALRVRLEDQREIQVNTNNYKAIDFGYAMTTYKSQGQTYDRVVVEADTSIPMVQDMRNTYVQITRARDDIQIYTDDKEELKNLAEIGSLKRDTLATQVTWEEAKRREDLVREDVLGRAVAVLDRPVVRFSLQEASVLRHQGSGEERDVLVARVAMTETRLNDRQDLVREEKEGVVRFLADPAARRVWESQTLDADGRIAAAQVIVGGKSFEEATKGLPEIQHGVVRALARAHARGQERGEGQSL